MSKIQLNNIMFYGFHGVYEYEREQGQKFYFDVEMTTADDKAAESDDLKDGVDYIAVYSMVKDVVENKRFQMLTALTAHIGDKILEAYPNIVLVKTRVRKTSVLILGPIDYLEVETERRR
jgi:7,8-dihydroneopterin aldolase/epimerase/oxygenase